MNNTKNKKTLKSLFIKSTKRIIDRKTWLFITLDVLAVISIIIAIALSMLMFRDSYFMFQDMSPELKSIAEKGLLDGENTAALDSMSERIYEIKDNMLKFVSTMVASILLGIILICAGVSFFNFLIWCSLNKMKRSLGLYSKFFFSCLLFIGIWIFISTLLLLLFRLNISAYLTAILSIIIFVIVNIIYSNISPEKRFWKNIADALKQTKKEIIKYIAGPIILFVVTTIVMNLFALILQRYIILAGIIIYACLFTFLSWLRYYFNEVTS